MVKPLKENMFLVDLGIDMAKAYRFNDEVKKWDAIPELDIKIESGSGARHMVMDKKEELAFVLSELTGEIFVANLGGRASEIVQKISFVPRTYLGAFGGAAIRMHPSEEYLYASNRGSDTIAIFKVDKGSGKLKFVAHQSTEGKTPRDFNIDPSGKWLIVNQDSSTIAVFEINS